MKKGILGFLFAFLFQFSFAQLVIKGKVTDAVSGAAIGSVSIYINNSSIGTMSDAQGNYSLAGFLSLHFDLVFSCVGYETFSRSITAEEIKEAVNVKLQPRSEELNTVLVQSFDKNGWQKWGKVFTDNLLGMGKHADQCSIKNKSKIKFFYDKATQELTAVSFEPLVIENKYLGYHLIYDMQNFTCNYKTKVIFFSGYPFFKNMDGKSKKATAWAEHRQYAYEGSMMHFMRALYKNKLDAEGFTLHILQRFANKEKARIRRIYQSQGANLNFSNADSSSYYSKVMQQSDSLDYLHKEILPADSIAYAYDSTTAAMSFKDHLAISYNKIKEMPEPGSFHDSYILQKPFSILTFVKENEVLIYRDGSYYEPANLLSEGYWAWSEKLFNLLPTDYKSVAQ